MMVQRRQLSDFEIDERAAEAKALLNNPLLQEVLSAVYSGAEQQLLNAEVGSLTAATAHAMMKVIPAVRSQLEAYLTDAKMRDKFPSKR